MIDKDLVISCGYTCEGSLDLEFLWISIYASVKIPSKNE